jgi:hypothetical protein
MMDLQSHWEHQSDQQLLEAAEGIDDYTDEGQTAIRAEWHRRGLVVPPKRLATFDEAERVARLYRRFVLLIAVQWIPLFLLVAGPPRGSVVAGEASLVLLGAFGFALVMTPITGYRLLKRLEVDSPGRLAGLMYWPLFSLFSLFVIAGQARQWGQRRGVAMGVAGPTRHALERLRQSGA